MVINFNEQTTKGAVTEMKDFGQMTNEELVVLVAEKKDSYAFDELDRRFSRFIFFKARKYRDVNGLTREDILQEGSIALYRASLAFDPARGYCFSTFFGSYLYNHYRRIFFERNLRKKDPLFHCAQIEYYDPDMTCEALHADMTCSQTEQEILDRELHEALMEAIGRDLSETERNVVLSYLEGHDYRCISEELDISEKSVDNALQRAKKKLRTVLYGSYGN